MSPSVTSQTRRIPARLARVPDPEATALNGSDRSLDFGLTGDSASTIGTLSGDKIVRPARLKGRNPSGRGDADKPSEAGGARVLDGVGEDFLDRRVERLGVWVLEGDWEAVLGFFGAWSGVARPSAGRFVPPGAGAGAGTEPVEA